MTQAPQTPPDGEQKIIPSGAKVAPHSKDKANMDPVEPETVEENAAEMEQKFEEALTRLPPG